MRLIRFLPLTLLLLVVGATPAEARNGYDVEDIVKESFKVRPGGTLYLEMDYGNIDVVVGDGDVVEIEMIRTARVSSESEARKIFEECHEYSLATLRLNLVMPTNAVAGANGVRRIASRSR